MRNLLAAFLVAGSALPAAAQQPKPADDEPIVVRGLADGARVVEVDFDKVWKGCAECKRALAKLDKLAEGYRDELRTAGYFASGGSTAHCSNASPSGTTGFQRSSARPVGDTQRRTTQSLVGGLCADRMADSSRRTFDAMAERHVVPEQARMLAYMRSFLDQLAPHVADATEAERVAHGAKAGLTDKKRTKLAAKKLQRIDVTQAVIRRLDASDFKIILPDPSPPGPARGGYEPPRRKAG